MDVPAPLVSYCSSVLVVFFKMAFTFEIQPTTVVKTSFDHLHQIYKAKSYLPPKDHKKYIHRLHFLQNMEVSTF